MNPFVHVSSSILFSCIGNDVGPAAKSLARILQPKQIKCPCFSIANAKPFEKGPHRGGPEIRLVYLDPPTTHQSGPSAHHERPYNPQARVLGTGRILVGSYRTGISSGQCLLVQHLLCCLRNLPHKHLQSLNACVIKACQTLTLVSFPPG